MNKLKLMYKINDYRDGKIDWDELSDLLDEFVRFECEREPVAKNLHKPLISDLLFEQAMIALDDYLNAGCKETRKKASEKAKLIYKEYYGVDYVNRNDR